MNSHDHSAPRPRQLEILLTIHDVDHLERQRQAAKSAHADLHVARCEDDDTAAESAAERFAQAADKLKTFHL